MSAPATAPSAPNAPFGRATTQVTCMLPVKDLARARDFYERALGLPPVGLKPDGKFVYRCGGTELALFPKAEGTKAEHTAVSFRVEDTEGNILCLHEDLA